MSPKSARKTALGKTAKKGVVWSFLREGVTEILTFPASMLLARLLTPTEFGIAAAANFFTQLAVRVAELGFNAAIVRAKVVERIHLSTVFAVNLAVGVLTFSMLIAGAPLVAAFYNSPETGRILPIAAIAFLITPLGAVPSALLSRNLQFQKSAQVDWYQSFAFAATTLLLAWLGFSYMSMVYGRLAAVSVQALSRVAFAQWRPSLKFSIPALREILSFGAGVHAKRLLDYTAQNVDSLVVGKVIGMEALGFYDKAFNTMNRFLVRMNTGGPGVTFRIFSIIHDEPERFRRAYNKVVMSATLVGFPVFATLIAMAPQLMVVLFGPRWLPAALPFQILCVGGALKLLNAYASSATQAAGRIWSEVWRQVFYTGLIVTSIVALKLWGAVGAAVGVLLATSIMTVLMHTLLQRVAHVRWGDILRPLVPAVWCAAGAAGVVVATEWGVRALIPASGPWFLVFVQGLAALLFFAVFVLFAPHVELRRLVAELARDLAPDMLKRQRWVQLYLEAQPVSQGPPAVS